MSCYARLSLTTALVLPWKPAFSLNLFKPASFLGFLGKRTMRNLSLLSPESPVRLDWGGGGGRIDHSTSEEVASQFSPIITCLPKITLS